MVKLEVVIWVIKQPTCPSPIIIPVVEPMTTTGTFEKVLLKLIEYSASFPSVGVVKVPNSILGRFVTRKILNI